MIVSISKEDKTFYIHKNIIIDENTTIYNYLEKIKNNIQTFYESGYPISTFNLLQIKLWNYEFNSVKKVLQNLPNNTFIATIEFTDILVSNAIDDTPFIVLSKPFLINKMSSYVMISKFIDERLDRMVDVYFSDDTIIQSYNINAVLTINYTKCQF